MTLLSPLLTIQYLEPSPILSTLDKERVIDRLRLAAERLPFTHLLIGWQVPPTILDACRVEAQHLGMRFLRWQPLLTPDPALQPDPEWRVTNLMGRKMEGFRALPEFTFACPNHPALQEAVFSHLEALVHHGIYQGYFLDRVRFPSPSVDPFTNLACFCDYCQHKAAEFDLDLEELRVGLLRCQEDQACGPDLVHSLLTAKIDQAPTHLDMLLNKYLSFRDHSISDFLAPITRLLRAAQLEIGLDCYSPRLAQMVGQDLPALSKQVDWIKLMTYAHTLAPAGLPYELSNLAHFLISVTHMSDAQALKLMENAIGYPLPASLGALEKEGLSSTSLGKEVEYGVASVPLAVLAGIELLDLEGVTALNSGQIQSDLEILKRSGAAGLAISWDLAHIPLERLDLVRRFYLG